MQIPHDEDPHPYGLVGTNGLDNNVSCTCIGQQSADDDFVFRCMKQQSQAQWYVVNPVRIDRT